jgi:hypothetical protein
VPAVRLRNRVAWLIHLRFQCGIADETAVQAASYKLRLGLRVEEGVVCERNLYDLMEWSADCPSEQRVPPPDGWYRLTVYTSAPSSGIFGDQQLIDISMERVTRKPAQRWDGVPVLCE